jgi:hypothetical protein
LLTCCSSMPHSIRGTGRRTGRTSTLPAIQLPAGTRMSYDRQNPRSSRKSLASLP